MTLTSDLRQIATLQGARSRTLRYLPATALLLDFGIVGLSLVAAVLGRREMVLFHDPTDLTGSLTVAGPLIALGWVLSLTVGGAYRADVFGVGTDEYKRVLNSSLVAAALTGVGCYLAKYSLSRGFFLLLFAMGVPLLLLGRHALRRGLHSARRHGKLQRRAIIAGSRSHVDELAMVLAREDWLGYDVIGAVTPTYDMSEQTRSGLRVLGDADELTATVLRQGADVLFIAGGAIASSAQMRKIFWELEAHQVDVVVAPSVTEVSSERISIRPVGGLPLMHIEPPTWTNASRWGKRTFDVVGALAILLFLSPLMIASALAIKFADGGPVFFRQTRTGRHGEPFGCFKFRSMVVDAEARLAELHAQTGHDGGLFKMKDDPRVTGPGRLLRRLSIDELPQLINVLTGDMSLVGPRPPLPSEVAGYTDDVARRLHVRPGMTGLWQVSGRSDLTWEEAVRLDLYYVDNWSMVADLAILVRTIGAVFGSRGAY